jgi:DNA invertase Pin-like site-specific DNA recombinase
MGREGESFQSPEQQRETIRGWAKLRGVEIAEWFEDMDKSGNTLSRPGLDALMGRINGGQLDGLAVARLDRLSRAGVADALRLVEAIHDAGGQVAAVDLGLDPTTPFGEFGMTIMLALARMERRRMVATWEVSKANAVQRGVHIGPTPYGYRRQSNGNGEAAKGLPLVPDENTAPIVRETFRLAAEQGLRAASTYLKEAAPDRASEANHIARMLARRVYLGEVVHGDRVHPDAHEPLVDRLTWERAQSKQPPKRRTSEPFPLSGIPTCAQCGNRLVGGRGGRTKDGGSKRSYRCQASLSSWKGDRCTAPTTIVASLLEQYVTDAMQGPLERFTMRKAYTGGGGDDLDATHAALERAEHELSAFATDPHARTRLGDALWQQSLDARADAVESAQAAYREQVQRVGIDGDGDWLDFPGTTLFWITEPHERRWFYEFLIEECSVRRGRHPVDERVTLRLRELPNVEVTGPPDTFLALHRFSESQLSRQA